MDQSSQPDIGKAGSFDYVLFFFFFLTSSRLLLLPASHILYVSKVWCSTLKLWNYPFKKLSLSSQRVGRQNICFGSNVIAVTWTTGLYSLADEILLSFHHLLRLQYCDFKPCMGEALWIRVSSIHSTFTSFLPPPSVFGKHSCNGRIFHVGTAN